jgi:hypothetical protein
MRVTGFRRARMLPIGFVLAYGIASAVSAEAVNYAKDVAPILQNNCQECHRPGEAVPMSLMSFEEVRPWARAIREAVETKTMPPWHADPSVGHWENERRLSEAEVETILAWVDQGARMGDPADLPPPVEYTEGWKIGEPDMIFEFPEEIKLGADLVDEYKYVMIPTGLTEDRWVQAAESRPGNPEVVHHIIAFVQEPGASRRGGLSSGLGGYAPGLQPAVLPDGEAMFLPAGSTLVLQMHYNKEAGIEATDRSRVGVKFARTPVIKRLHMDAAGDRTFVIPPGDPNYEVVGTEVVEQDIVLQSVTPHMHLRGKSMRVWAELPDGTRRDLLWVPRYDFNWQTGYRFAEPMPLPAGSKIVAQAHFDNSTNNPFNPDPTAEVRWGLPTYAEMMFAFYSYTIADEELNVLDPGAKVLAAAGAE